MNKGGKQHTNRLEVDQIVWFDVSVLASIFNRVLIKIDPGYTFTGKSLSDALIFESTNSQYDDILFIELQVQYMKIPSSEHWENMLCTEIVFDIQNNL